MENMALNFFEVARDFPSVASIIFSLLIRVKSKYILCFNIIKTELALHEPESKSTKFHRSNPHSNEQQLCSLFIQGAARWQRCIIFYTIGINVIIFCLI
jgi:hypothetical protein